MNFVSNLMFELMYIFFLKTIRSSLMLLFPLNFPVPLRLFIEIWNCSFQLYQINKSMSKAKLDRLVILIKDFLIIQNLRIVMK